MLPLALLHDAYFFSNFIACHLVFQHPINDSLNSGLYPPEVLCVASRLFLLP